MRPDQLCAALIAGSEEAWEQFLDDHGGTIYGVACRFGLSRADREDLFQNTCLRALRSIKTLRDPSRLSSWVYSTAHRLAIDMLRRHREVSLENPGGAFPPHEALVEDPDVEERIRREEEVAKLFQGMDLLDARCQRLLKALYLQDRQLTYEQIGRQEGMPVGSIGPTRARCLRKLKTLLDGLSNDRLATSTSGEPGDENPAETTPKKRGDRT